MPDYKPPFNVVVKYATNGSFNEDIICDYLTEIMIGQPVGTTLIFDSAKCHLTSKVNDKIREFGLNKVVVPPRLTNLLQPADVGWFSLIKQQLHEKWNTWFLTEEHQFTTCARLVIADVYNG
jgi:DDE superfamily endonuclease